MDYVGKVCSKDSQGHYGACYDPSDPNRNRSNPDYPCRIYDYHQRGCKCTYSKITNRFCSSSIDSKNNDDHTMRIKYVQNDQGIEACSSNNSKYINSYVDHVCWYGTIPNGVSTVFHGYTFYRGESTEYNEFLPGNSWFHSNGDYEIRVIRNADINGQPSYEDGCRNTCIYMTEKWMSPVTAS